MLQEFINYSKERMDKDFSTRQAVIVLAVVFLIILPLLNFIEGYLWIPRKRKPIL